MQSIQLCTIPIAILIGRTQPLVAKSCTLYHCS